MPTTGQKKGARRRLLRFVPSAQSAKKNGSTELFRRRFFPMKERNQFKWARGAASVPRSSCSSAISRAARSTAWGTGTDHRTPFARWRLPPPFSPSPLALCLEENTAPDCLLKSFNRSFEPLYAREKLPEQKNSSCVRVLEKCRSQTKKGKKM